MVYRMLILSTYRLFPENQVGAANNAQRPAPAAQPYYFSVAEKASAQWKVSVHGAILFYFWFPFQYIPLTEHFQLFCPQISSDSGLKTFWKFKY